MSKDKEPKPIRVPIPCPDCLGRGFYFPIRRKGSPPTITYTRCLGTGNIGYIERTQAEIEATQTENERGGGDEGT